MHSPRGGVAAGFSDCIPFGASDHLLFKKGHGAICDGIGQSGPGLRLAHVSVLNVSTVFSFFLDLFQQVRSPYSRTCHFRAISLESTPSAGKYFSFAIKILSTSRSFQLGVAG